MKDKIANPSPLGSLGFGMTTILYSIVSAGFFEINSMLISMAIFLGGAAQLLAGYLAYKRGNTFGYISYSMFGFYWLVIVFINLIPVFKLANAPSPVFMGWFFLLWTVFCVILFLKTLPMDRFTQIVFGSVVLLFLAITLSNFTGIPLLGLFAGYWGIVVGAMAMYSAYRNFD